MKNPKIILCALGGVTAVIAFVLIWFVWSGASERAELSEQLSDAEAQADRLMRLPVRPCPAAIDAVASNESAYVGWRTNTLAAISRGDRTFGSVTPPAFKTFLVNEARRLSSLPGSAEGKLVKKDFAFGFKDYITGGVLPAVADLPRLQREWSDVTTVVELLATNGVSEILDLRIAAAPVAEKSAKEKKRRAAKDRNGETAVKTEVTRFTVDFLARPEALVALVNGTAADVRFAVIEDFGFAPVKDALAEELGAEEKPSAAAAGGGSRRSRRRAAREEAKEKTDDGPKKTGAVTDPATAAPIKVTMTFAVYDFQTAGVRKPAGGEVSK